MGEVGGEEKWSVRREGACRVIEGDLGRPKVEVDERIESSLVRMSRSGAES